MRVREFGSLAFLFVVTFLLMATFAFLKYLQMPVGTLLDWVIGVAAVWWLTGITTIPWDMHFSAKEVIVQAQRSREKSIQVRETDVKYAQKLAKRFLLAAILLHVLSAAGLYLLAYYRITPVGYLASVAALLLTFARPAYRLYEHIARRLRLISEDMRYPHDDVQQLRQLVHQIQGDTGQLKQKLDETATSSWAYQMNDKITKLQTRVLETDAYLQELDRRNAQEHELLARKTEDEMTKISEDAQFLKQVREIIQFFKKA